MSTDAIAAIGALLTGFGSVVGGIVAIRIAQRRSDRACDERIRLVIEEYERGFERGMHLREDVDA